MSKICKKCGKEIPQSSEKELCENCLNKRFGKFRNGAVGALSAVGSVLSFVFIILLKNKSGGKGT